MIKEFKNFLIKGNALSVAIGMIIGAAFTSFVTSIVSNLLNPLLGLFTNSVDLNALHFTIGKAVFNYGNVIESLINFIITGFVIFILIKLLNDFFDSKIEVPNNKKNVQNEELEVLKEIKNILSSNSSNK